MVGFIGCAPHIKQTLVYAFAVRGVTRLDGTRGKKQAWSPYVRTEGVSKANVLH